MELAKKVIEKHQDEFGHITTKNVVFVSNHGHAQKRYLGKCRPIRPPYSLLLGEELCYIIEMNEDRLEALKLTLDKDKKAIKLLIFHEMKHIPEEGCIKGEKQYRKIIKHDVDDFSVCLEVAGGNGPYDWVNAKDLPDITL